MTIKTIQVTLGAAATKIQSTSQPVKQLIIQNNAAAVCRVGDANVSATRGISLAAAGAAGSTLIMGDGSALSVDISTVNLFGTATQVIDVVILF